MYGESSTQIRVAADIRGRSESSQIRPEKMSMDVAEWMSRVSQSEMMAAVMYTNGEDLVHLLGEHNAQAWDMLVKQIPIERLMREAKTTVEASELRRPNHERDTANAQALQQYLMPVLQMYAQSNGNYEPLNGFIKSIGESMEMDVSQFLMPSTPPDPEQMKLQQQAQQTEIQETAASAQHKTAQAAKAKAEAVATLAEIAGGDGESPEAGPDPMLEQAHMQKMRHNEELHNQKLIAEQEKLVQDMVVTEAQAALDEKLKKQQLAQKKATGPRT
jgi:hypothetical protein